MPDETKLPHYARKALGRIKSGKVLVRTSSDTDEAITKGGGYLYSTHPDGKKFPPGSGRMLIDGGYVEPNGDGLFAEVSQTFHAAA